ncbi:MAG: ABC transporter substrate-binding protein [Proteobacteria bacterium]|nr:ABC transporter substrate-binding protein [Pseudomonadota bacterium]MBU1687217.1 ABC transporter substrate-binding protein [Pseudomonadota bacterium]
MGQRQSTHLRFTAKNSSSAEGNEAISPSLRVLLCILSVITLVFSVGPTPPVLAAAAPARPVFVGFDAEQGHLTSTSDEAISIGILTAMAEINTRGGVLDGRPLQLIIKDNRSVPARGIENIRKFAAIPDLLAVVGGKFSPVILEEIPLLHETKMIMLDAWGAADGIIDNDHNPNYCFRLSLRDSWAIETMITHAQKKGLSKLGVLFPTTSWGRSNDQAIRHYVSLHPEITITQSQWYHWGDQSLLDHYQLVLGSGAEAVLLIANEAEGSILVKEVAALPPEQRFPIISHWGVSGGNFVTMAGKAIEELDFSVVQTFSFFDQRREEQKRTFYKTAGLLFQIHGPEDVVSPVGAAQAYDLIHILALAVNRAGTTDRAKIRAALEQVTKYDGLIKFYQQPFSPERHEALAPKDLFMGTFRMDGSIHRIEP